jgi:hypothetical protein
VPEHMPIHAFLKSDYADLVNKYFKFTFVRNPYDRLYSGYVQDRFAAKNYPAWTRAKKNIFDNIGDDFNRYIMEYVRKENIRDSWDWICFCPMHEFAFYDNRFFLDWFGRVENIEDDFSKLSQLIGIDVNLSRNSNVRVEPTGGLKYLDKYESSTIEKVNSLYKEDFEYFNYAMLNPDDFPDSVTV